MEMLKNKITDFSVSHYKLVTAVMVLFTLITGAFIPMIKVDTDPENMLSHTEPVRVFHDQTKKQFGLSDIVVLGIINEDNQYGVFNPETLSRIYDLTEFAKTLRWADKDDPGKTAGVEEVDMIAPSLVDHIGQDGPGVIKFEWLMSKPPATQEQALEIRDKALSNPMLTGTMVSEDGKAIMVFIPLTDKHLSYKVYSELNNKIEELGGNEEYFITGLPVAEDTFGVEMFVQMAVSAPLAMLTIFVLMLIFFRKLVLIISPMIIAMVSVISTMGLLIGFGFPVHIMSSMIPIFLMPIAVVDSVHILSEFFDMYTKDKGKKETIKEVMGHLFVPMLYTSLTSAAGFLSLALTPIPPVQIFGIFVSTGIMIAWLFTVSFVPAYVMMIPEKKLENFGMAAQTQHKETALTRILRAAGAMTYKMAKPILVLLVILVIVAGWGITKIQINDNPVKWFSKSHPIRQADIALNDHFGGTYMAYLVLGDKADSKYTDDEHFTAGFEEALQVKADAIKDEYPKAPQAADKIAALAKDNNLYSLQKTEFIEKITSLAVAALDEVSEDDDEMYYAMNEMVSFVESFSSQQGDSGIFKQSSVLEYTAGFEEALQVKADAIKDEYPKAPQAADKIAALAKDNNLYSLQKTEFLEKITNLAVAALDEVPADDDEMYYAMNEMVSFVESFSSQQADSGIFKQPAVLEYMAGLQDNLEQLGLAGKSSSIADVVKKVHQELIDGDVANHIIPENRQMVSECLIQYQQSHRPGDLWHFVTPDYEHANIWLQLTSGDNKDMEQVIKAVDKYFAENTPPVELSYQWAGLTYINTVWQNRMVSGMLESFLGSFIVVFIMMSILFRSPLWGLLCMVPLTITIAAIYGTIGFIGKDYDMPVAVLSALTLGMAVDFAIHFLERSRATYRKFGSWKEAAPEMFGEPARAITRNVLVIAIGFLPLLAAPLMPYKTVGVFLCAIMAVSGIITLLVLPAFMTVAEKLLFKPLKKKQPETK